MALFSFRRSRVNEQRPNIVPASRRSYRRFHIFDTAVGSDNIGDEIIMEAAREELLPLLSNDYISTSSSHDGLGEWSRPNAVAADYCILMGTNALTPRNQLKMDWFIWTIEKQDIAYLEGKVVLMGVGANKTFDEIDPDQRDLLARVLSPNHLHSVRDELGLRIVEAAGHTAINTSCVTLWQYGREAPELPAQRSGTVCFTLTAHRRQPSDVAFVNTLRELYEDVYFWPQQPRDLLYLEKMPGGIGGMTVLPPNLRAYDQFLAANRPDVVGTRLHGSIRGLAHGCRSLALAVDHRAMEIGTGTGFPVLPQNVPPEELRNVLDSDFARSPQLDLDGVSRFLGQFDRGL